MRDFVNHQLTHIWLKQPGLSRNDCKKILQLQDGKGDIRTWAKVINRDLSNLCRKCHSTWETVGHVLGACKKIPFALLKSRHDGVVLQIANEIIRRRGLGDKLKLSDMGRRIEKNSDSFQLVLDQRLWVEGMEGKPHSLLPDIIAIDHASRRVELLEVAVPAEDLIKSREEEKSGKYLDLIPVLRNQYPGFEVKVRAFIIGQLGVISKRSTQSLIHFLKRSCKQQVTSWANKPKRIRTINHLVGKIQNVGLKGSLVIYSWLRGPAEIVAEESGV